MFFSLFTKENKLHLASEFPLHLLEYKTQMLTHSQTKIILQQCNAQNREKESQNSSLIKITYI